ncbi:hypothetical protein M885DRAFT_500400 [Pelagophyceae sp. CCMP2097]|nr:hypothetical protein M885DRAFT_500400 [Pelagophyceae sp. CCMP2097]
MLECAERLRCEGAFAEATALLRRVVALASRDVARAPSRRKAVAPAAQRAIAAYQLATLLFQAGEAEQGDAVIWRLGFTLRLNDGVLAYDRTFSAAAKTAPPRSAKLCALDGALAAEDFDALRRCFGAGGAYWGAHEYPTQNFFSYNVRLDADGEPGNDSGLGALRDILQRAQRTVSKSLPGVAAAKSVEVWAHAREGDGHHQLHYDLDENALRRADRCVRSPIASSVLYVETVDDEAAGAPTLVVDRALGGDYRAADDDRGWLIWPKPNRLLTFNGDLLHAVVPTICRRPPQGNRKRVTVMLGWWGADVDVSAAGTLSPNVRLEDDAPWLRSALRAETAAAETAAAETPASETPAPAAFAAVPRVWHRIAADGADRRARDLGAYASDDVTFTGRFFLRDSVAEIDAAVVEAPPPTDAAPIAPEAVEFVSIQDILAAQARAAPAAPAARPAKKSKTALKDKMQAKRRKT